MGFDLSHLPQPLPGLIYAPRDLGVEQYTTTGLFKPDAPDHQLPQLQAVGVQLPFQLFLAMPYILTIVAVFLGRKRSGAPIALGVQYVRE